MTRESKQKTLLFLTSEVVLLQFVISTVIYMKNPRMITSLYIYIYIYVSDQIKDHHRYDMEYCLYMQQSPQDDTWMRKKIHANKCNHKQSI